MPWLIPFLRSGKPESVARIAEALALLTSDSVDQHLGIAEGTGAERYIRTGGYVYLYKSRDAFAKDAFGMALRRTHGFEWDELDRPALADLDPALSEEIGFGARFGEHGWITDPSAYVAALFAGFRELGGAFEQSRVLAITPRETGVSIATERGETSFDRAVLASGAWSRKLAESLGHRVPLETERGYHLMLKGPSTVPPCPYMVADAKFAITPMDRGVRCAGLVEFGGLDAPPSKAPLELFRRRIRRLYPGIEWEGEETWLGHRPSTTDSLPLIGESTRARGVYFAFGAQHIGLTTGPKTGRLIADLIAGRRPNIDLAPFRTDRFDRA